MLASPCSAASRNTNCNRTFFLDARDNITKLKLLRVFSIDSTVLHHLAEEIAGLRLFFFTKVVVLIFAGKGCRVYTLWLPWVLWVKITDDAVHIPLDAAHCQV